MSWQMISVDVGKIDGAGTDGPKDQDIKFDAQEEYVAPVTK